MPRIKIEKNIDQEIVYSQDHWNLLNQLRDNAKSFMKIFSNEGYKSAIYGSVSRGDIKKSSDIDIILLDFLSSYRIELLIEQAGFSIINKSIVQATPSDVIKGHIMIQSNMTLTFLLTNFTNFGLDFYKFGGLLQYNQLLNNDRVSGIDKRLVLIEPNQKGHREFSIIDNPNIAARRLGISFQIIEQRIRVLTRRDKIGRTGVFLNKEIAIDANFEEELLELAKKNSLIRRRLKFTE